MPQVQPVVAVAPPPAALPQPPPDVARALDFLYARQRSGPAFDQHVADTLRRTASARDIDDAQPSQDFNVLRYYK